jgi:hypothetical protein
MAHVFQPAPETVRCTKCLRDVVIASILQRTMQSDCLIADCPIRNDPHYQPSELWGTSISFTESSEISQEGRISRFKQWEKVGLDVIKADLLQGQGMHHVGGPQAIRDLAWEWVRKKEAQAPPAPSSKSNEILSLKPGIWGFSVDLKELWRKRKKLWRKLKRRRRS